MKISPLSFIIRVFKGIVAGIQGLVSAIIFLVIICLIVVSFEDNRQSLPEKAALTISPNGDLVEQKTFVSPIKNFLNKSKIENETLIFDLIHAIDYAATDPHITSLVLELDYLASGGISKLEEVGAALNRFKSSGKPIIAVGDSYSQEQYYLASYADEIHLHPMGSVMIKGYGRYTNYLKEALDKLRININIFRVGTYKDAVEPFSRSTMSDASKEHTSQWLNELWQVYTTRVEGLRGLPQGSINDYANTLGEKLIKHQGNAAQLALEFGLVDRLSSRGESEARLVLLSGLADDGGYEHINASHYLGYINEQTEVSATSAEADQVALIVAKGVISEGDQPDGAIGSESLSDLLQRAREDDKIKAVVLRLDSPGGSAFASEIIRQEIIALKNAGKPVVVSMGSVAASGGYWIAMGASEIWANSTTITGSIGVFGIVPTFEGTLKEAGVQSDGVGTTALSDMFELARPMSGSAKKVFQAGVDYTYNQFLKIVAEARNSSTKDIGLLAQGRVWTGVQALKFGLIDQIGSLDQSLDAAAKAANLAYYEVVELARPLNFREQILKGVSEVHLDYTTDVFSEKTNSWSLIAKFNKFTSKLATMAKLNDSRGIYLSCFECLE
tara:strand:+ start:3260 stop:5104 length:1845 start_codon:yes stop_codon:yes gene_type:complete